MQPEDDPETPPGSDRQWWLTQGPEFCYVCESSVHPEVLFHCVACDRALCLSCLDEGVVADDILCPECGQEPPAEKR